MPWTVLGNHDKTLARLEKNAAKAHNQPTQFCTLSVLDPLHGERRHVALLHRLNLAPNGPELRVAIRVGFVRPVP